MTFSDLNKERRHNESQEFFFKPAGFQGSAMSSAAQTNINFKKRPVLHSQFQQMNNNKYDFEPSDNDISIGNRYEEPMISVHNLRGPGSSIHKNSTARDRRMPSDGHTVAQAAYGMNPVLSVKNLESATEFTEPFDNEPNRIDIETDKSLLNVGLDPDDEL